MNTYLYSNGNPVKEIDPYGLDSWVGGELSGSGHAFIVGLGGGAGSLSNTKTGETCFIEVKCLKVGPGFLVAGGAAAKGQVLGPQCGKDLEGFNFELAGDIVVPGGGGLGGSLDVGSLGAGASVGHDLGAGFFLGANFCFAEVIKCVNTPCDCQK